MRALKIKSKTQIEVILDARPVSSGDIEIVIGSAMEGYGHIIYLSPDQAARLRDWLEGALKPTKAKKSKARTKVDMTCRAPRCKQRSKGPRFRYLCDRHLHSPKKIQAKAGTG